MDLNAAQQSSAVELVSCIISKPNNLISTRVLLSMMKLIHRQDKKIQFVCIHIILKAFFL